MKQRGFTMVELMIVIAIIAVLASIVMPKMSGARNASALNACKANIRSIVIALELYANDNQNQYSPAQCYPLSNGSYPITGGYLKAAPTCPLGNPYYVSGNNVATAVSHYPGWNSCFSPLVACWNNTYGGNHPHPGVSGNLPHSWPGSNKVWDN